MAWSLRELAAIQFIGGFDTNNYYESKDLFERKRCDENAIRILTDLNLVSTLTFKDVTYYKILQSKSKPTKSLSTLTSLSVDPEVLKFKKIHSTNWESLLRQVKLLQSIRSSGEEDKLIELIDKWESVTKEVIKELYEHQKTTESLKSFVKKLGLNWDDLGFSDESDSEISEESECESDLIERENDQNYENDSNYYNTDRMDLIEYISLIKSEEALPDDLENKKLWLLASDMILKEHYLHETVYIRALEIVSCLTKTDLNDNDWIFVIDSTRKGIKRLRKPENEILRSLLNVIRENSADIKCTDHLLKLLLTCKELGITFELNVEPLYHKFFDKRNNVVDFDEFYFIKSEKYEVTFEQRCQRLLLLINPLYPEIPYDYCFELFSISDSELIKYMRNLINCDHERFIDFYSFVINEELLSVDFFIEQLLTDSVSLLELLLVIFSTNPKRSKKDFKNFHTLLFLKLEMFVDEFPFDCSVLIEKLKLFLNKL